MMMIIFYDGDDGDDGDDNDDDNNDYDGDDDGMPNIEDGDDYAQWPGLWEHTSFPRHACAKRTSERKL